MAGSTHEERETIRHEIVSRMRELGLYSVEADGYASLQSILEMQDVKPRSFRRAITGSQYKDNKGPLRISRRFVSMASPRTYILTRVE